VPIAGVYPIVDNVITNRNTLINKNKLGCQINSAYQAILTGLYIVSMIEL